MHSGLDKEEFSKPWRDGLVRSLATKLERIKGNVRAQEVPGGPVGGCPSFWYMITFGPEGDERQTHFGVAFDHVHDGGHRILHATALMRALDFPRFSPMFEGLLSTLKFTAAVRSTATAGAAATPASAAPSPPRERDVPPTTDLATVLILAILWVGAGLALGRVPLSALPLMAKLVGIGLLAGMVLNVLHTYILSAQGGMLGLVNLLVIGLAGHGMAFAAARPTLSASQWLVGEREGCLAGAALGAGVAASRGYWQLQMTMPPVVSALTLG